jgi:hypothetical protein
MSPRKTLVFAAGTAETIRLIANLAERNLIA